MSTAKMTCEITHSLLHWSNCRLDERAKASNPWPLILVHNFGKKLAQRWKNYNSSASQEVLLMKRLALYKFIFPRQSA